MIITSTILLYHTVITGLLCSHAARVVNSNKLVITGESNSGKTHIARIWQKKFEAIELESTMSLSDFIQASYEDSDHKYYFCDGIQNCDIDFLFAMWNWFSVAKVLFTCDYTFSVDKLSPDMRSRFLSASSVNIEIPDGDIFKVVAVKMLSDMQLKLKQNVVDYIVRHCERSFEKLNTLLLHLNSLSLEQKRNISIPFVKEILKNK